MRLGNLAGRLVLVVDDQALDIERASHGQFSSDPQLVYKDWDEFTRWAAAAEGATEPVDVNQLGPPVPHPGQVFAIGFNYLDHIDETSADLPKHPMVFTKFPSCITGPNSEVDIAPGMLVDWEVELVVVIGRHTKEISVEEGWSAVAGLTVGQDLSDRRVQMRKPAPEQYSLGKSRPGFGPIGPFVVTPDELVDRDDLAIESFIGDEQVQGSRTCHLLFTVPDLISQLSDIVSLTPGDLIFTGTPAGIGAARTPPRWLQSGDILTSRIEGLGTMTTCFRSKLDS